MPMNRSISSTELYTPLSNLTLWKSVVAWTKSKKQYLPTYTKFTEHDNNLMCKLNYILWCMIETWKDMCTSGEMLLWRSSNVAKGPAWHIFLYSIYPGIPWSRPLCMFNATKSSPNALFSLFSNSWFLT